VLVLFDVAHRAAAARADVSPEDLKETGRQADRSGRTGVPATIGHEVQTLAVFDDVAPIVKK